VQEPLQASARHGGQLVAFRKPLPELQKARIYEQLLLDIIMGEFAPGEQLEERALSQRYDAGLAGIRDALSRLDLEGLVARRPRHGTFVAPLDVDDLRQDYEARMIIEPECAAMAALYGSDGEIAAIADAFKHGEEAAIAADTRALVAMDQRFHAAVARAAGNTSLSRVLIPLQHKATRFWIFSMKTSTEAERMADVGDHRRIASLISAKDADGARAAMRSMLQEMPGVLKRVTRGG